MPNAPQQPIERQGFVGVHDYINLPRAPETWLIKDLVPQSGAALIYSPPKTGKAIWIDEPIPTPLGWRTMKTIRPRDFVFGSSGQPVEVLAVSPILTDRPCYRVTFDDNESIIVDANHEWTVTHCLSERGYKKDLFRRTVTTEAMSKSYLGREYPTGHRRKLLRVQLPDPLVYPNPGHLPLDPYLLGTWLGDGSTDSAAITTADQEIVTSWADDGWDIHLSSRYGYYITHPSGKCGSLLHILRQLHVLGNKHIPIIYLRASVQDRTALLQGLMDTDGYASGGRAEFSNMNHTLASQVYELAVSLGTKVSMSSKPAKLYGRVIGTAYTVSVRSSFIPFRLTRKATKFNLNTEHYRAIRLIEQVPSVPVKCIVVDATDHLFLAGKNCLPTHNSALAIQLAHAISGGSDDWLSFHVSTHGLVLYLQLDTPRSTWALRFDALTKHGLRFDNETFKLADRESIAKFPFDVLLPDHTRYLQDEIAKHQPVAVIVDTLREAHSGDEDKSTSMRNVIANLVGATFPAALIVISHDRKPNPDADKDIMADHRGSNYVVGRMDAIMRLTKSRLYYAGRSIEEGSIKIARSDCDGALLWEAVKDETEAYVQAVLADTSLPTMRAKARALAPKIGKSEEAAMSCLRRSTSLISEPKMRMMSLDEVVQAAVHQPVLEESPLAQG